MILIVVGELRSVPNNFETRLDEMEIIGRMDVTLQPLSPHTR